MQLNNDIMKAVESLGYRVTVGDVAAQSGLKITQAEPGVLALAAETQAHMQVAESGDIAYEFPRNFRTILRNKYWQVRLQETWARVWQVLFYIIRLSFGVVLIASIAIMIAAIIILMLIAQQQQQQDSRDRRQGSSGGMVFSPHIWFGPGWYRWFDFGYGYPGDRSDRAQRTRDQRSQAEGEKLNFLESIFSFLFGDGDPNADLEERRWNAIATVIRNHRGAIIADQIAPYLDDLGQAWAKESEDYMLPVLTRFNGHPKVSPEGDLVYYFPELQVTATSQKKQPVANYLREIRHRFSAATGSQMAIAIGLGSVNFIAALILGALLQDPDLVAQAGSFVLFVQAIYGFLWVYGAAFLAIPLVRYWVIQGKNRRIESRNEQRQSQAAVLTQPDQTQQRKLNYAQQFATETIVHKDDLIYTTETDLLDQEQAQKDRLDAEWLKRLEQSN
jgi:hypothetical protein